MSFFMIVMTKCRVLFLVGLMVAVGGCDEVSSCPSDCSGCASVRCFEIIKNTAVSCVNDEDIRMRLGVIYEKIREKKCLSCCEYQTWFCREMLEGLKK